MDFELLVNELKKLNSQIGSYAYYILGLKYAQELNDVNIAQLIKTAGLTESMSKEIGKAKKVAELIQSGKYGICFESSSDGNVVLIKNKKENNVQYSKEQIVKILADLYDSDIEKSAVGGIFIFKYGKHVVDKYTPTELMREAHLLNPNVKERYAAELNGAFLMYRYFQNNPTEFDVSCDHNIPELFAAYLKNEGKSEATVDRYVKQVPQNGEVQNIVQSIAGTTVLFDVVDVAKLLEISQKVAAQDFDKKGGKMYSAGINAFLHFVSNLNLFRKHISKKSNCESSVTSKLCDKLPLQTIYYGAPGTGKSNTIKCEVEDAGKIHFRTTFHPDSDYSTFVGCYKPTKNVRHNLMSYVELIEKCKEYAKRAGYNNQNLTQFGFDYYDSLTEVLKDKTLSYASLLVSANVTDTSASSYVTAGVDLHTKIADKIAPITYDFVPQAFVKAYCEAWNNYNPEGGSEPVFLIIEEINRGNCAQIFGDIFQLLDREMDGTRCGFSTYPIDADEDLKKFLLNGTKEDGTPWLVNKDGIKNGQLCLPPDLHIWATMNTSDQSLFPIDSAFKRRWDWEYVPIKRADKEPENKWIIKVTHGGKTYWCYWWEFLEAINHQIEETNHSEDKQLGYFFAKPKAGENFISTDTFVNKVIFYLWNDVFKDEDSAVFQYDNEKVKDFSVNRAGTMYFRHFMENTDEMIHYFINQLFAMGKDNNPVVPIDYLKNDADPKVFEYLPKMREDCEETPMPKKDKGEENAENDKVAGEVDGKSVDTCNFSNDTYKAIAEHIDRNIWMNDKTRGYFQNGVDVKFTDMPISYARFPITFDSSKNQAEIKLYIPSPSAYNKSGELYTYLKGLGVENIVQTLSTKFQFEWHELGDQNPQSNKVKGWALTLGVDYNNDAVLIANQIISLASEFFYNVDPLISSFINTQR